jgi:muramidase (phage lysozyme)
MYSATIARALSVAAAATLLAACSGSNDAPGDGSAASSDEALSAPTCAPSLAAGAVPRFQRALLDTIAFTEGTRGRGQDGYNVTYAYHYFTSCAKHPNINICSGGLCSTAAGRYQFLNTTWGGLGFANFHPDNQDRGAMKLVTRRKAVVPTTRAMTSTEFLNVLDRISYEWASLPAANGHGRYGQPNYSVSATRSKYCSFAGC